jgi:hypothetical protein
MGNSAALLENPAGSSGFPDHVSSHCLVSYFPAIYPLDQKKFRMAEKSLPKQENIIHFSHYINPAFCQLVHLHLVGK